MPFSTNVFINCPFDTQYQPLLRPLIFTVLYFNLEPRLAQTRSSSTIRINQIKAHIKDSKYGIHDLSRSRAMNHGELPRFNLPYELGLDIGCAEYGNKKSRSKKILILEREKYHYQKVISDIAGQDIADHNDDPETLIRKIRNWFSIIDEDNDLAGASEIWLAYNQFYNNLSLLLFQRHYSLADMEDMPSADFVKLAKRWITNSTS